MPIYFSTADHVGPEQSRRLSRCYLKTNFLRWFFFTYSRCLENRFVIFSFISKIRAFCSPVTQKAAYNIWVRTRTCVCMYILCHFYCFIGRPLPIQRPHFFPSVNRLWNQISRKTQNNTSADGTTKKNKMFTV